jgi:hypothetical protein
MTEMTQMAWFIDPFAKRRFNDVVISSANEALPSLIQRVPVDQPINAEQIADAAYAIASAMAKKAVEHKLI